MRILRNFFNAIRVLRQAACATLLAKGSGRTETCKEAAQRGEQTSAGEGIIAAEWRCTPKQEEVKYGPIRFFVGQPAYG